MGRHNRRRTRPRSRNRSITLQSSASFQTPQNTFCEPVSLDNSPATSCGSPAVAPAPIWHFGYTAWQTRERPMGLEAGQDEQCRLFGGEPGDDMSLCDRMLEFFGGLDYINSTSSHALGD
ncbi:uncharacterized protein N7511_005014 [Penicillium nucicola]|uniref:uncharacterized protein n=1 Tax=Penicillium nucicola TaxID=1850975 RepID=UPI002545573C|nr:uncharacterized protein N7511_005014 [Penicillium nucicola]KAJ5767398.1 hypothetical protein N7511_005014 [Penicillium nucicola]